MPIKCSTLASDSFDSITDRIALLSSHHKGNDVYYQFWVSQMEPGHRTQIVPVGEIYFAFCRWLNIDHPPSPSKFRAGFKPYLGRPVRMERDCRGVIHPEHWTGCVLIS